MRCWFGHDYRDDLSGLPAPDWYAGYRDHIPCTCSRCGKKKVVLDRRGSFAVAAKRPCSPAPIPKED